MTRPEIVRSPPVARNFFYGYIVVLSALIIMLVSFGTLYAYGVFFTPMLTELNWTRAMTSGAFSLCMLVQGLLAVLTGGITDRLGSRLVMTVCGLLLGLGYLLMSQISVLWQLYLFYGVITGIGMSGAWVPLMSTVARWFTKRRTMMSGIVLSGTGVGTLIVPPVASWLISIYDWRISFIIIGSVVLVIIILAAQFLRRDPAQMGQEPFGEDASESEWQLLKARTAGFSLKEAVCTRQFWIVLGMFFFFGFCMFSITVHIVPHAIGMGIPATSAANILAAMGITVIVGRVALGSVADRIGDRNAFIIGFILMLACLLWLIFASQMWMFYLFAAVFGFAHGGMGASESPLVAGLFGLRSHGLILGAFGLGLTSGAAVGPLLAGYIFDVTGSYHVSFLIFAAAAAFGVILSVILVPIKNTLVRQ